MPIRCLVDKTESLFACDVEREEVVAVQACGSVLSMPCCGSSAIFKMSKLGTKFFAHKARVGCEWKPETPEHNAIKQLILLAAREEGWAASTEVSGASPAGEVWRADVLVEKGRAKIAFEVQWTSQTENETRRRQEVYRSSGIRCCWIMRQVPPPISEEIPAVSVHFDEGGACLALIPDQRYVNNRDRNNFRAWHQVLPLSEFVRAALSGRFKFGLKAGMPVKAKAVVLEGNCYKCRKDQVIVDGIILEAHQKPYRLDIAYLPEEMPALWIQLEDGMPTGGDHARLAWRTTGPGGRYFASCCRHCGATSGRFFAHEYYPMDPVRVSEFDLDETMIAEIRESKEISEGWSCDIPLEVLREEDTLQGCEMPPAISSPLLEP